MAAVYKTDDAAPSLTYFVHRRDLRAVHHDCRNGQPYSLVRHYAPSFPA